MLESAYFWLESASEDGVSWLDGQMHDLRQGWALTVAVMFLMSRTPGRRMVFLLSSLFQLCAGWG